MSENPQRQPAPSIAPPAPPAAAPPLAPPADPPSVPPPSPPSTATGGRGGGNTPPPPPNPCPPSPQALAELVEYLYPEPGVVDILTLDQFIFRYKFSGLGAAAVADMERAQRITRTIGDHGQIGLAEFHIGLIYLHWQQPLAAAPYFNDALRHWQFSRHRLAVALAQFALGAAHHHAYHYENALTYYGKARQTVSKLEAAGAAPHPQFRRHLGELLAACLETIVGKIRRFGEGEPAGFRIPLAPKDESGDLPTRRETAVSTPHEAPPPAATSRTAVAPQPIINLNRAAADQTQLDIETTPAAREPVQRELPYSPIPDHPNQSERHVWYRVVARSDQEIFPQTIQPDTTFLVDTRIEEYDLFKLTEDDLVIVKPTNATGSVQLKPQEETEVAKWERICLAKVTIEEDKATFSIGGESGDLQFYPDKDEESDASSETEESTQGDPLYAEDIIGIVIGIWSQLKPNRKTA